MRICRYFFLGRSYNSYLSLHLLLWRNSGYIYKLIAEENLFRNIMESAFLGQWEFVYISFEGDPPRAVYPFLFFCGGILATSTNWLLKKNCSSKSWEVLFLGQWGFVDISFEGDPRAISPFLFFCGECWLHLQTDCWRKFVHWNYAKFKLVIKIIFKFSFKDNENL